MSESGATAPVSADAACTAMRTENEQLLPELRTLLERAGCFEHAPGIVAVKLTVVA
jgi:hypothetical protein